ncbi:MAG: hypothetical protein Q7R31_04555 [Candidatus Levybacteria bacterium]|nr:hypothetical protein [Candidatus Levybacteria bacterium]
MTYRKEGPPQHLPVVRSKIGRGAIGITPDRSIYPASTKSKDLRPGAKRFNIEPTLADIHNAGKPPRRLRRKSRNF